MIQAYLKLRPFTNLSCFPLWENWFNALIELEFGKRIFFYSHFMLAKRQISFVGFSCACHPFPNAAIYYLPEFS